MSLCQFERDGIFGFVNGASLQVKKGDISGFQARLLYFMLGKTYVDFVFKTSP